MSNQLDNGGFVASLLACPLVTAGLTYLTMTAEPSAMWPDRGHVSGGLILLWVASFACLFFLAVMVAKAFPAKPDGSLAVMDAFAQPNPDSARFIENDELIAAGIIVEF